LGTAPRSPPRDWCLRALRHGWRAPVAGAVGGLGRREPQTRP